jgi:hypothetical protein
MSQPIILLALHASEEVPTVLGSETLALLTIGPAGRLGDEPLLRTPAHLQARRRTPSTLPVQKRRSPTIMRAGFLVAMHCRAGTTDATMDDERTGVCKFVFRRCEWCPRP